MTNFDDLLKVLDRLLAIDGCPWDQKQTISSLRPFFIEEAHELVDAIDEGNREAIIEEAGDLLHTVLFLSKIAEKNQYFKIEDILEALKEKLVRRHPHIFGEESAKDDKEVIAIWNKVKAQEKSKKVKFNSLPILEQAQKAIKKLKIELPDNKNLPLIEDEDSLGEVLFELAAVAEAKGLNANLALIKFLKKYQKAGDGLEA